MDDDELDDVLDSDGDRYGTTQDDLDALIDEVQATLGNQWTRPQAPVDYAGVRWKPHLAKDSGEVCHVHVVDELAQVWLDRIEAARRESATVSVVAPLVSWYSDETLLSLLKLEVRASLADRLGKKLDLVWFRSVPILVGKKNITLRQDTFREALEFLWKRALTEPNSQLKGDLFEDLVVLVFSQSKDFVVFDVNFENPTEEFDVVLHCQRAEYSSPLALASAKNQKEAVPVKAISSLHAKMGNRRGMCKLGFIFAARTISSDAPMHLAGYRGTPSVIVTVEEKQIQKLVDDPSRLDEFLHAEVMKAILR